MRLLCTYVAKLFYGCENGRSVVSDSDSESGVWTEAGETFDTREIEAQSRSPDLHSESCFCLRLGAEWTVARARVGASVNFACDAELLVDAKDSGESVSDDVVLRKQFGGRSENRNSEISKSIEAPVVSQTSCQPGSSRMRWSGSVRCPYPDSSLEAARQNEIPAKDHGAFRCAV